MKLLHARTFDRVVQSLFACVLFLTVLFLWHRTHERSCLALAFPGLAWLAIFGGLLHYRLERKRFAVDYYLDPRSSLHRRLRRSWPSVLTSLILAAPLAAFLVVFAARARPTDWFFLCAAATVAPLLFNALSCWPGGHLRRDAGNGEAAAVADILVSRMAGTLLLAVVAVFYVYAGYYLVPVPGDDIFPGSLERTLEAFSARARSACPLVDDTLVFAAQLEGLSWFLVTTTAASPWLHDGIGMLLWVVFFLNAAMCVRGLHPRAGRVHTSCLRGRRTPSRGKMTSTGNGDDDMSDGDAPERARRPGAPPRVPGSTPPPAGHAVGAATWARRTLLMLMSGAFLSVVFVTAVVDSLPFADPPHVDPPPHVRLVDSPCAAAHPSPWRGHPMTDAELERLAHRRWLEFRMRLRDAPLPRTEQALRDHVGAAFESTYARIPEFLDWHYSLAGQYTQLGQAILRQLEGSQLARAALERLQSSQMARAVLDRLGESELAQGALDQLQDSEAIRAALDQLRQGVDARLYGDLPDRIGQVSDEVERALKEEVGALVERRIRDEVETLPPGGHSGGVTPCPESEIVRVGIAYEEMLRAAIPRTLRRFTSSAAPTGIIAAGAALPGAAAAGALVRSLSRRLFARTASRTARAIGAAAGGLATGTAAWLLVDAAVLFVDEHFNRDDLERELTELVDRTEGGDQVGSVDGGQQGKVGGAR